MVTLLFPATGGGVQFEVPQEVVGLLEVRANCVDLVNQVLHADDAELTWNTTSQRLETQEGKGSERSPCVKVDHT